MPKTLFKEKEYIKVPFTDSNLLGDQNVSNTVLAHQAHIRMGTGMWQNIYYKSNNENIHHEIKDAEHFGNSCGKMQK